VEALSQEPQSTFIAGGIDLIRRMRGGDRWDTVIDISSIDGMRTIAEEGDHITIGALATHRDIETSRLLGEKLPDFQVAWTTIGNVRVRAAGTLGGNILAGEAAYDGLVVLGVLDAEFVFSTYEGEVVVAARKGPEAFPARGLLIAVRIPFGARRRMLFDRSLKPVVSVAVSLEEGWHAIGVGCAFPHPVFRVGTGGVDAAAISGLLPDPLDNPLGGAEYRRRMVGVLASRLYQKLSSGN
jgi:CO/xanthine dehydrogenase FAD-binding subunit